MREKYEKKKKLDTIEGMVKATRECDDGNYWYCDIKSYLEIDRELYALCIVQGPLHCKEECSQICVARRRALQKVIPRHA